MLIFHLTPKSNPSFNLTNPMQIFFLLNKNCSFRCRNKPNVPTKSDIPSLVRTFGPHQDTKTYTNTQYRYTNRVRSERDKIRTETEKVCVIKKLCQLLYCSEKNLRTKHDTKSKNKKKREKETASGVEKAAFCCWRARFERQKPDIGHGHRER